MGKLLFKIFGFLFFAILIFSVHRYYFAPIYFENQIEYINFSYLFNAIASLVILGNIFLISFLNKDFLGFLLILLGLVKILFFFALLKKYNFPIERNFFLSLFLPYVIGKTLEILTTVQILKDNNYKKIKGL